MIYIGLGSNMGERLKYILFALRLMERLKVKVVRISPIYQTEAVGPKQPKFLNAVAQVSTSIEPKRLLFLLKWIERRIGRRGGRKWGPRKIDLDILMYKDLVLKEKHCCIPHKLLHERSFVLLPLSTLCAQALHPLLGEKIQTLLERVGTDGVQLWGRDWRR